MGAPKGHAAYNVNGEGGRPRKYDDKFLEGEAEALQQWIDATPLVMVKSFARKRGYNPGYLANWSRRNKKFRIAYKRARQCQEVDLMEAGLHNKVNFGMAKFILSAVHGIKEGAPPKGAPEGDLMTFNQWIDWARETQQKVEAENAKS